MEKENSEQTGRRYPGQVLIYRDGRYICWSTTESKPLYYNRTPLDFWKTLWTE